jgi:hypothetical protein
MNRKRGISEVEDKITLDFETPETLRDSYVNALKEWEEGIKKNQDMMNLFILNKISFIFLILLGILAYSQPNIMAPLSGEELTAAKTAEMRAMVQEGLPYDLVVKNVEEFANKVTQVRFSFQGGQMLTAVEILNILKGNSMLLPFITQMESVFNILTGSFNEVKGLLTSSYSLLDDLSKGNINRKNIGDFVGYGIWSIILYIGYKVAETSVNITKAVGSTISKYGEKRANIGEEFLLPERPTLREYGMNSLMHLNIDGKDKVVFLGDILDTINTRPPAIVGSFFDMMLAKLFEHQEAWMDLDESDDSSIRSASTVATQITSKSVESMQSVSNEGYGGEYERMAEFINTHMGSTIIQSSILLGNGFTNLYASMLNITCNFSAKMEAPSTQETVIMSQESANSSSSMSSLTRCSTYSGNEIDDMAYSAITNTFSYSMKRLFGNEEVKGGKMKKRNRTSKKMKKMTKKRKQIKRKKRTMKRVKTRRIR